MSLKKFIEQWTGHGCEKSETQIFWLKLIQEVFGIETPEKIIRFEVPVPHGFIDALIEDTNTLIEQKSSSVNLDAPEIFLQAKRYNDALEWSRKVRRIVTCNFREFRIYNMDKRKPEAAPLIISLADLERNFHALDFLIDREKIKIRLEHDLSIDAGKIVAKIYNELLKTIAPGSDEKNLNILCVRIIFCLYAESVELFGKHKIFRDYLQRENNIRRALRELFEVLNTPEEKRSPYLDDALKNFPYVNGGLFAAEIDFPNFTPELRELLLEEASSNFNWEGISPTIFGTVFESTLNPATRREDGMHYTDVENIHKVIDPLFMENLREEFSAIKSRKKLLEFQKKIAAIKIFDPACGSGNFLTESYLSLRRFENELLKKLLGSQIQLGELDDPIKVSIQNFFGIELNDFAVSVAKTSMWIAELKMKRETAAIVHKDLDFLPLKIYPNILRENSLRTDWKKICPSDVNYIIGNPPFVGKSFQTREQKSDMAKIFASIKNFGNLDYVACWYKKAADFIQGTKISCAFLSTNSISQGIAVEPLWNYLFGKGIVINFAHQTFKWDSESTEKAAVHCVVVGFANFAAPVKKIFNGKNCKVVDFINAYLVEGANIIVKAQANAPEGIPPMLVGSCPVDDGNFLLTEEELADFLKREPAAEKYIRPYVGSKEFIQGKKRFCLYLKDCPPNELRKMPLVMERVKNVREFRLVSKKAATRRRAETPTLFTEDRFIDAPALLMPMVSGNRKYIPMGFVERGVIVSNKALFIPNAEIFHFGVLTSSIHMAWMRAVAAYLGTSYSYSATIVYNTFPWCKRTAKIEATAQNILDVRKKYFEMARCKDGKIESENKLSTFSSDNLSISLADLYDELSMPKDLHDAHKKNDRAVAAAYGFEKILEDESKIVAELMKMYSSLTN